MFRPLLILVFIQLVCQDVFAQKESTIRGAVENFNGEKLPFATVILYNTNDDLIQGAKTNDAGKFNMNVTRGYYYLVVRYAGLQNDTINIGGLNNEEQLDLGTITLNALDELDEVEIVAQKSAMKFHLDKRVYNVASDLNNQGANVVQVLENIPSILVDAEGNISLRGNSGVRILINGKKSGLATNADALKQLQAGNVERIEIVTNPSAKYDAEGSGGIINIILKENKKSGISGSLGFRAGYYAQGGVDGSINIQKNKVNVFANYNLNFRDMPGKSETYQRMNNTDTAFAYRQKYQHQRQKLGNNAQIGLIYDINDKNSLSTSFSIRSGLGKNDFDRYYDNMDLNDNILSDSYRYQFEKEIEDMKEANLNYAKKFNNKAKWTVDLKWYNDSDIEKSDYQETFSNSTNETQEYSEIAIIDNYYLAQSDFVIPFFKEAKIETGVRTQKRVIENQFKYRNMVSNNWVYPMQNNDTYDYDENILAAYVMGSNSWEKFSFQAGLRAEYSNINTFQEGNKQQINRTFFNLFPSTAISYKTTQKQTIQLSFSRRINRPGQRELIPISSFGDNHERRVGNPQINPEYTNATELGLMQNFNKGSLLATVYYRYTNNEIERISTLGSDGIIYITPMNLAKKQNTGVELNATYNPVNWMRINVGFNFFHENLKGSYNQVSFEKKNLTWTNRTAINFLFPKIVRAQLSFNYRAPSVTVQGKRLAIYHLDISLSRELFNNKATIGFNVRDLFNSRRWKRLYDTPELYTTSNTLWRPRSFTLTFVYRFNQDKKQNQEANFENADSLD